MQRTTAARREKEEESSFKKSFNVNNWCFVLQDHRHYISLNWFRLLCIGIVPLFHSGPGKQGKGYTRVQRGGRGGRQRDHLIRISPVGTLILLTNFSTLLFEQALFFFFLILAEKERRKMSSFFSLSLVPRRPPECLVPRHFFQSSFSSFFPWNWIYIPVYPSLERLARKVVPWVTWALALLLSNLHEWAFFPRRRRNDSWYAKFSFFSFVSC